MGDSREDKQGAGGGHVHLSSQKPSETLDSGNNQTFHPSWYFSFLGTQAKSTLYKMTQTYSLNMETLV